MKVPYVDLAGQHQALRGELLDAVGRVLDHGQFILGPEVEALETQLSAYLGAEQVVSVSSGSDALLLALRLCEIGEGDEVITVSHSFVATASAIMLAGATPVFVDIDESSMVMDPAKLEAARTPRTRAVLPVHLNGTLCDMASIQAFCERHGLALIEDAAQALGACISGRFAGTFGIGAFSLHPLKVLGACGDAGFVALRNDDAASKLRRMRNVGLRDRDHCEIVAGNSRLDALQAAILKVKLQHLDDWLTVRRGHADAYREALDGRVLLPPEGSYSAFVIRHPDRDALLAALRQRGIDAKVHYPLAIHQQPAFAHLPRPPLPVTERVVGEIVSLPVSAELGVGGRRDVIEAVDESLAEIGS